MKLVHYPKEAIDLLTELVKGEKFNAKLLAKAGFPELSLIPEAINGNRDVIQLIHKGGFFAISAFLSAILSEDKSPVEFLIKAKAYNWVAVVHILKKDKNAKNWLLKNNLEHYVSLAEAIQKRMAENEGTGFEFLYKGPYS